MHNQNDQNEEPLSLFMFGEPCSHLGPTTNCVVLEPRYPSSSALTWAHAAHTGISSTLPLRPLGPTPPLHPLGPTLPNNHVSTLEVPRRRGWDLCTETPSVLNNTCRLCSTAKACSMSKDKYHRCIIRMIKMKSLSPFLCLESLALT